MQGGLLRRIGEPIRRSFFSVCLLGDGKAKLAGAPVIPVDPRNTSRTCPKCGHIDEGNRIARGLFLCRSCGHFDHADIVGATNVGRAVRHVRGRGLKAHFFLFIAGLPKTSEVFCQVIIFHNTLAFQKLFDNQKETLLIYSAIYELALGTITILSLQGKSLQG
jgi:Putative transposase DNA-binding domain